MTSSQVILPIELLPEILQHILKPQRLATLSLVSRTFYIFAAELLYERIHIYPWYRSAKLKECHRNPLALGNVFLWMLIQVLLLFETLAQIPALALHVHWLGPSPIPCLYQLVSATPF